MAHLLDLLPKGFTGSPTQLLPHTSIGKAKLEKQHTEVRGWARLAVMRLFPRGLLADGVDTIHPTAYLLS